VHAFDQAETLLGQGSVGLELASQSPALDTAMVAVGGGGLIGGIAAWYAGSVRIIGVAPVAAPTLTEALRAGHPVDVESGGIAADSLAPRRVGTLMFPIAQAYVDRVLLVSDVRWPRCSIVGTSPSQGSGSESSRAAATAPPSTSTGRRRGSRRRGSRGRSSAGIAEGRPAETSEHVEPHDGPTAGAEVLVDLHGQPAIAAATLGHARSIGAPSVRTAAIQDHLHGGIAGKCTPGVLVEPLLVMRDDEDLLDDWLRAFFPAPGQRVELGKDTQRPLIQELGERSPGISAAREARGRPDLEARLAVEAEREPAQRQMQ